MRNLFIIITVLGISIYTIQADVGITFTFANGNVSYEGGEYYYDFDVMAAASETGTRIGTGIVYINYNTNAFGTYIHTNSNVVATKGELIDITYGPFVGYNLIPNDNDIGRVAYTFEYIQDPGFGEELPVTATQLIHLRIKIQDTNQTSDLSFENSWPTVMSGQQYYDDNITKYDPVNTENELDTPLPVGLSQFTGNYINGNVCLNWTTQSEFNNSHWFVYRSVSQNFGQALLITPSPIPGAGTTSQPTFYQYEDLELQDYIIDYGLYGLDTFWYWLESVSYEGDNYTFGPVGVELSEPDPVIPLPPLPDQASGLVKNFPNPFNPVTYFEIYLPGNESGLFRIMNLKGEIVEKRSFQAGHQLHMWDASGLASGIYLCEFSSYGRETKRIKILLLK